MGTRARTGTRRRLPLLLLLAAACVPALGVGTGAAPPAAASTRQPSVAITKVTPKAPGPDDTVAVTGTVANAGETPRSDAVARLHVLQSPLTTRGSLDQYAREPTRSTGVAISGYDVDLGDLRANGSAPFRVEVPVSALGIHSFGVYLIGVDAVAGGTSFAFQRSFLVYAGDDPDARPSPTRISWVWPLTDAPRRLPDGTFTDDRLAAELRAGGRLRGLVDAGASAADGKRAVPLTWAVDANLLDDVRAMTGSYRVRTARGKVTVPAGSPTPTGGASASPSASPSGSPTGPAAGVNQDAAKRFLSELGTASGGQTVLPLPYADTDVSALVRAGLSDDLTQAITRGRQQVRDALPDASVADDVAWPPGGRIDQAGLDALAANEERTVILQDRALPLTQDLTYTPDALASARTATGQVHVLLADSVLGDTIASASHSPGGASLAEQRFLAETALITAERPNVSRGLVVTPPRYWDPPPGLAAALLRDTGRVPWLRPASLSSLGAGEPTDDQARQRLSYGAAQRHAELHPSYLERVDRLHRSLTLFAAVFNPLPKFISDYNLAVLRTESAAWRTRRPQGAALLRDTRRAVHDQRTRVHIAESKQRTLTSQTGRIPITIENTLSRPVTIRLDVRSANPARMHVGAYKQQHTIAAQTSYTVNVPVRLVASGTVEMEAQLLTPDGRAYAPTERFPVLSTAVGRVAVVVTGAAVVVLFAGSGYRLVKRIRAARRGGSASGPGGPGGPDDPGDDGGPPPGGRPPAQHARAPSGRT